MSKQPAMGEFVGVVKRNAEKCRLVITLDVTIPRECWPHYRGCGITDAVDALRQDVQYYQDGFISLEELIDMADQDGVTVVATK